MRVHEHIDALLRDAGGILAARRHPEHERTLQRLRRAGLLASPLPGVYVLPDSSDDISIRIRAAAAWAPEAVLTGAAAARCTFWPEIAVRVITLVSSRKRTAPSGFALGRGTIPPELVIRRHDLAVTAPALTALDLGGEGIDRALLRRCCTLDDMAEALALTPGRSGNRLRRALLHDSRDEPWSEAERLGHAILRHARIRGWRTNVGVRIAGSLYFLDIAFEDLILAIEIDGFTTHRLSEWEQFQRDRRKWSALTAAGWRVLHFSWHQLLREPDWVIATVLSAIDLARAERRRIQRFPGARGR